MKDLLALLEKIKVDGYGSRVITINELADLVNQAIKNKAKHKEWGRNMRRNLDSLIP